MTTEERSGADFRGTGVTIGRHPMAYRRAGDERARSDPAPSHLAQHPRWPPGAHRRMR